MSGLSPRVRGNLAGRVRSAMAARSIPACAGEPRMQFRRNRTVKVYPRVCGGTQAKMLRQPVAVGLSPRVRGNQITTPPPKGNGGSIPACAGEPTSASPVAHATRVYPRVCGGTELGQGKHRHVQGLSPRVRGNPMRWLRRIATWRSIPACAGEPSGASSLRCRSPVYPRVCGGTPPSPGNR